MSKCKCVCTCTPAEKFGLTVNKTVVRIKGNNMVKHNLGAGALAVMVRDDGSECPKFQELSAFLRGDEDDGSVGYIVLTNHLTTPNREPRMTIVGEFK